MDFCLEFKRADFFPTNDEYEFALTYLHLKTKKH